MAKTGGVDAAQLKGFMDRVERLEEEMTQIRTDVREIYAEAKDFGYDPKIMRTILRLKKLDEADRSELDELTETYRTALNV
ncbi:MAG: DUF2312 domain-containing protein [Rickettsiales bacterium]|jgi:uncharacterized protein (UPF0335 family)|nr:DUF2312 domain-containing protein [Rickettsiales bacterium]